MDTIFIGAFIFNICNIYNAIILCCNVDLRVVAISGNLFNNYDLHYCAQMGSREINLKNNKK